MNQKIDKQFLNDLTRHTRRLGVKKFFKSMGYERCAELTHIASKLSDMFDKNLKLLDIGSGNSVFPSYLLKRTKWDITCLDKYSWIEKQYKFAEKVMNGEDFSHRFHIINQDFLNSSLPEESFDLITNISVIEHFEDNKDASAMHQSAKLLKSGGIYILTTLMNERYFKEFYLKKTVYGEQSIDKPVFYQRHYDVPSLEERIIKPTRLKEKERIYFGEYDFQFFEKYLSVPPPLKPFKIFYQWGIPFFAKHFLTYRNYPISRANMKMMTSSGVIVTMVKS